MPSINWSDIATIFRILLREARESICITTAYFVPDEQLNELLCAAAERGVDVRLLVPGEHTDELFSRLRGEDYFRRLLGKGVAISLYESTMLHAKNMTADHSLALVGSANMNHRSMSKDEAFRRDCDAPDTRGVVARHHQDSGFRVLSVSVLLINAQQP